MQALDPWKEKTEQRLAGILVTRAQFARMMSRSKQAVTDWVKSGCIVVGADRRFDPRQAVARLLATGDPARLRAKILRPLVDDIAGRDRRIIDLEAQLATTRDDAEFHAAAAAEYAVLFEALAAALAAGWEGVRTVPAETGLAALLAWLDCGLQNGVAHAGELADYLPATAPTKELTGECCPDGAADA